MGTACKYRVAAILFHRTQGLMTVTHPVSAAFRHSPVPVPAQPQSHRSSALAELR